MVIGRVLPESLSFSGNSNNALSESTSNNILKGINKSLSGTNKYSSRLQSISPIKLDNTIDSDGSDEETTNTTTIHYNSNNSRSNLLNIFTPNTATTAVDSNNSESSKGDDHVNKQINKQEMKLKKLRKFTEENKVLEEEIVEHNNTAVEKYNLKEAKESRHRPHSSDYYYEDQDNRNSNYNMYNVKDKNREYLDAEEDESYITDDFQQFNRVKPIPFDVVESRRQPKIVRKKSMGVGLNPHQPQLRFVDNGFYEEEEEDFDDAFNTDLKNYAFLVEQQERLLYEQEQLRIQQEKVNQLSRSTSLRNLQHNMRAVINQVSPIKSQRILSRSSSRNTLNSYLPVQKPSQQIAGHKPRLSNAKSMMNLRSNFQHKKSFSSNPHNDSGYAEDDIAEEQEPEYGNHMYPQHRKKSLSRFKSMNNLRINTLREENLGVPRKHSTQLRPRLSSSSLYRPSFEEENGDYDYDYEYDYDYDYESEYMDDTFQQDFQSQQIPFNYQKDKRMVVDYWSVPQEISSAPFKRHQRHHYELKPPRIHQMPKGEQLNSFKEQQHMAMNTGSKTKKLKFIPQHAASFKDGDRSGVMVYNAAEKRWLGNMDVMQDMTYLPDANHFGQQFSSWRSDNLGKHAGSKPQKSSPLNRNAVYQNFKQHEHRGSSIDVDVNFPNTVLAQWYSFEVELYGKIGHWLSPKNEQNETDDWEIYNLVLGPEH